MILKRFYDSQIPRSASDCPSSFPHLATVSSTIQASPRCVPRDFLRMLNISLGSCVLALIFGCGGQAPQTTKAPEPTPMFKPQEMADAIHAVVAADRRTYAIHVTARLASEAKTASLELPLPTQMLRFAAQEVQKQGAEFHYVLRSLSPVNPKNAPETSIEKAGLEFVLAHPETNYYSEESLGGRRYLTAVYPDIAFSATCTDCHNRQTEPMIRKLKPGDVLGGLVVRVPLEF